jgi:hypothetical protein
VLLEQRGKVTLVAADTTAVNLRLPVVVVAGPVQLVAMRLPLMLVTVATGCPLQ